MAPDDPFDPDVGGASDADGAYESVVAAMRDRVEPDEEERAALSSAVEALRERTQEAVVDLPVAADVIHVGSTARGTWLAGDRDVDLFVRFPPDLPRERLEEYGLAVGRSVLPDAREAYAEHPYVRGTIDGFAVDLVPCYRVERATEIRSAVDRTPFHSEYLAGRIDDAAAFEIRLAKRFLGAAGVYGSDLRTRGFSGYLTELLVLEYGGFRELLAAVADWHPPVRLDPAGHGAREFDDPLAVVDPTDPERNVAAVVDEESVARLQHHARAFLDAPSVAVFEDQVPDPLDADGVCAHLERRGTDPLAVRIEVPALLDDQLYPQLRRSLNGLERGLTDRGFAVLRSATWATPLPESVAGASADAAVRGGPDADPATDADAATATDVDGRTDEGDRSGDDPSRTAVLFLELSVSRLPAVERHGGPPVHVREHADAFLDSYDVHADAADAGDSYGPFVDGDRYVVEREREVRTAGAFASDHLDSVALGAAVERAAVEGHEVIEGAAVAELAGEFGAELARYFAPRP